MLLGARARARAHNAPLRTPSCACLDARILSESDTRTFAFLLFFGGLRAAGGASKTVRQAAESVDIFVGRYLLASTLAYVSIKLVHYKLFPDFP